MTVEPTREDILSAESLPPAERPRWYTELQARLGPEIVKLAQALEPVAVSNGAVLPVRTLDDAEILAGMLERAGAPSGPIEEIRRHLDRGDLAAALDVLRRAAALAMMPDAKRGRSFRPKGRGASKMAQAVDSAFAVLGRKATRREVLAFIGDLADGPIQTRDTDGCIEWLDHRGRDRTMTIARFENLVAERRPKKN